MYITMDLPKKPPVHAASCALEADCFTLRGKCDCGAEPGLSVEEYEKRAKAKE